MAKTLYEKLFDAHVVYEAENETPLLYIDHGSQRLYPDERH